MIDLPIRPRHTQGMRIDEAGCAVKNFDVVTLQLIGDYSDFGLDDLILACHQVGKRQLLGEFGAQLAQSSPSQSMNVLDRVLECFAGEGSGIKGGSSKLRGFLDEGHPLGQLCRLDCRFLAGWSAADHY